MVDINLVALDGSVTAQKASNLAIQIARIEHQKISGLYIVDEALVLNTYTNYKEELGRYDLPSSRAELIKWFEAVGNEALDQLEQLCVRASIPVTTQLLFGGVPELVLENASQAQMLTLGRRGRRHEKNSEHLGSYFRQIAYHSPIPILAGGDIDRPIKHLFLLHDGSPGFDLVLDWTVRLQHHLSAKVYVAVMDQGDQDQIPPDIVDQMVQHELIDFYHQPLREESIHGVIEAILASETDLILVGGYHHPEILEWLVGSKNDQILRQSQLPVLIA
jgi:nucleotide-binding universal stress UspA family protein